MTQPCCPKCESNDIRTKDKNFGEAWGFYIYCADCGAIITWVKK